jgi:8-amino-7-oxononanoate synthase
MQIPVAIIGAGAHFPGSPDAAAFQRMVRTGAVHVGPVPRDRWDHSVVHSPERRQANKTPAKAGSFMEGIDQFAPEFFGITPKRARVMDPQQRLMLEVARQALEDAGYARRRLAEGRVGVYVGACSSDHRMLVASAVNIPCDLAGRSGIAPALTAEVAAAVSGALPPIQAYSIVGQQLNMIAANVSQAFDFTGPALALDTACSSALAALHEAVMHLRSGLIDAALVGGVYVQLDPIMMVCFSRIGALSFSDNCRPFGADADGFVLGEGVGAVALKRLADAERDGDRIVAVIRGIAMNNDGRAAGPLTPDAAGQSAVIRQAWADAGLDPATVGLLEAHATATPVGDGIELAALNEVFATKIRAPVPISSIKANIGHGLASAGMASLLKAAFAVHDAIIPPQPGKGPLRAEFAGRGGWLRVPERAEPWTPEAGRPRRAGVSAFGFGGTNVHVVLEEPPVPARRVAPAAKRWRFEFSAPDVELLTTYVEAIAAAVRASSPSLNDIAHTLARRRTDRVSASFSASSEQEFFARTAALCLALVRGDTLPVATDGENGDGQLVLLPPSPLAQRRFWLIDEKKTGRPADQLSGVAPTVVVAPEPAAVAGRGFGLVVAAIAAVTAWRPEDVRPEQRFAGELGFDSLTTLEFMTVLGRSLPGSPPPPRTLFTPALTVAELVAFLDRNVGAVEPDAGIPAQVYELTTHPWLKEHRPGGRALLPLAALVQTAQAAVYAKLGPGAVLSGFKVLTPVEIMGDRSALSAEIADDLTFTLRSIAGRAQLATGVARLAIGALPVLEIADGRTGALSLETFYAEFGFHGPALQALAETPVIGLTSATGRLRSGIDEVVMLDGALQLALYWLAATHKLTAVATGFADFRQCAPWPKTGPVRCVATLAGEAGEALRGHFDFRDEAGALIAQWRGVDAQVIQGSWRNAPGTGAAGAWPEVRTLAARKAALAAAGFAMPYFRALDGVAGAATRIEGRPFVNFSSYNYLGLAGHPTVKQAAAAAIERYGTSASASRVASGERPLHRELEREIAAFLGCEDALALVSGHATNVTVIGHLFGPEDLVIHDQLAHDCIVTGARLSGARRLAFPHNDLDALAELLSRERPKARRALIAIEGVYSMDGDLAPLPRVVELKQRHDALLLLDEAHSLGVLGATGRGAGEHFGVARGDVDLWMGTMSKALASCGGYLAGAAELIDYLRFTLPGFVYSVGLTPADAAAALAALRLLEEQPALPRRLQARSELFRRLCRERGVEIGASEHAAVVPCVTGASERALRLAQALGERSINVQPIFHPAVEEGRARLRFFLTAEHLETQLRTTADALAEELAALARRPVEARP